MISLLLLIVICNAQPFANRFGQPLPYVDDQESFRAEAVLHQLNMKYLQLRDELYRARFAERSIERRRYFARSPMDLYQSEHSVQFLHLKTYRIQRTITIILQQMGKVLASLNKKDRDLVVVHLGLPASTIKAMKAAQTQVISKVPERIPRAAYPPMEYNPMTFNPYY